MIWFQPMKMRSFRLSAKRPAPSLGFARPAISNLLLMAADDQGSEFEPKMQLDHWITSRRIKIAEFPLTRSTG